MGCGGKAGQDFVPLLEEAFRVCRQGVPGPVFVECPADLLYDEKIVRHWYVRDDKPPRSFQERMTRWYLNRHLTRIFDGSNNVTISNPVAAEPAPSFSSAQVTQAAGMIDRARHPVVIIGSQAVAEPERAAKLAEAVERLGLPVYLSGMARGLLGRNHPLQMRHKEGGAARG